VKSACERRVPVPKLPLKAAKSAAVTSRSKLASPGTLLSIARATGSAPGTLNWGWRPLPSRFASTIAPPGMADQ
jgi:hypothetical protein